MRQVYKLCTGCNVEKPVDKFHTHHIFPWHFYPELRYNEENGMCLTREEHKKYHKIFGNKFDPLAWMEG